VLFLTREIIFLRDKTLVNKIMWKLVFIVKVKLYVSSIFRDVVGFKNIIPYLTKFQVDSIFGHFFFTVMPNMHFGIVKYILKTVVPA
jgi:hypothetical protein